MSREDRMGSRELDRLAREELRRQGPGHPAPERLTAYRAGELDGEAAEAVEAHLSVCRECVAILLEMPRFYAEIERPEAAVEIASAATAAASLRAFRARLAAEGLGSGAGAPTPPGAVDGLATAPPRWRAAAPPFPPAALPFLTYALAAGLAACLIGFPLWMASRRAAGTAAPPTVVYLPHGAEVYRGEPPAAQPTAVRVGAGTTLVLLPAPAEPEFASYRIDLVTSGGQLAARAVATPLALAAPPASPPAGGAAGPRHSRFLGFGLAGPALPAGDYRLRLFGLSAGRAEKLAEHPLRILAP